MFKWRINAIAFSGGEILPVEEASVLLIIGPNSSGKSAGLRDLQALLQGSSGPHLVVQHATIHREGTPLDLEAWFADNYPKRVFGGFPHYVTRPGASVRADEVLNHWSHGDYMTGIWQFLSTSLDTAGRTTIANYTQAIDIWNNPPSAYVHLLQTEPELHKAVNQEMYAAFGQELVIDWSATPHVGFRVGKEPARTAEDDRVSEAYAQALKQMPRLDDDGDGIKSFAGCLLATYCGSQPVLMIDEPEAFLHPPQARRLAAALARAAKDKNRQVVVATHSADIVQGALNADGRVAVCRLTREEDLNHAAVLDAAQLTSLWSKPLLRSAAAIDGLFHVGVVVCEADADVRLYETALRRAEGKGKVTTADLFFTQGGGKGELATLAQAYASLKTRTAVVADIDLLRNPVEHHKVLSALGSSLDTGDPRYKAVMAALGDAPPIRSVEDAVTEIRDTVEEISREGEATRKHKERISRALQESSKFSEAKRYGVEKLRGEPLSFARQLLEEWRQHGLFVLPVGELESWWPEGPANNKGEWIVRAIELLAEIDSLPKLEDFVCDVAGYFQVVEPRA
jgi:energy-coupling factor transporter ATP-binding protein EcfA2